MIHVVLRFGAARAARSIAAPTAPLLSPAPPLRRSFCCCTTRCSVLIMKSLSPGPETIGAFCFFPGRPRRTLSSP